MFWPSQLYQMTRKVSVMVLVIVVAILALFGIAAQVWGADSRSSDLDRTDPRRTSVLG